MIGRVAVAIAAVTVVFAVFWALAVAGTIVGVAMLVFTGLAMVQMLNSGGI